MRWLCLCSWLPPPLLLITMAYFATTCCCFYFGLFLSAKQFFQCAFRFQNHAFDSVKLYPPPPEIDGYINIERRESFKYFTSSCLCLCWNYHIALVLCIPVCDHGLLWHSPLAPSPSTLLLWTQSKELLLLWILNLNVSQDASCPRRGLAPRQKQVTLQVNRLPLDSLSLSHIYQICLNILCL